MNTITLRDEPSSLLLGRKELEELIRLRNGDAALLYLYILKNGGRYSREDAAKETGLSVSAVDSALAELLSAALVAGSERGEKSAPASAPAPARPAQAEALPHYPPSEIRHMAENDGDFASILSHAEGRLRKILSPKDEETLLGLYDALGFSPCVLMLLLSYCVEKAEREKGKGARVSMRQVEREAFYWKRTGIDTEIAAEQFIREKSELEGKLGELMKLLGFPRRAPNDLEREYLEHFLSLGMENPVYLEAYNRTVLRTGGLKWDYMASILTSWAEKGLLTIASVNEKDPVSGPKKKFSRETAKTTSDAPISKGAVSAAARLKSRIAKQPQPEERMEE